MGFTASAPADTAPARIISAVSTVRPIDETSCILESGADDLWMAAVSIGALGYDFRVDGPPELVAYLRQLSDRYGRAATGSGSVADTQ